MITIDMDCQKENPDHMAKNYLTDEHDVASGKPAFQVLRIVFYFVSYCFLLFLSYLTTYFLPFFT